jgi:hypothetical protein
MIGVVVEVEERPTRSRRACGLDSPATVQSSSFSPTPKCSAAQRMPNKASRATHSKATTMIRTKAADMATPGDSQRPISVWNVARPCFVSES